ncbi:hypothetical protein A9Z42_0055240 [Trichoderma parareesei]|uniref:Uncharacterized protein n=1 Tax=Trichoderma parareesei TaxID=858221 RepID=A0A2H2ZCL2_TRIPA|nr:hypothetical protein A9Z42_0055240 [Trichoderma parareesei]
MSSLSKQAASSDKRSHACDSSYASAAPSFTPPAPQYRFLRSPAQRFARNEADVGPSHAERALTPSIAPAADLSNRHLPSARKGGRQAGRQAAARGNDSDILLPKSMNISWLAFHRRQLTARCRHTRKHRPVSSRLHRMVNACTCSQRAKQSVYAAIALDA